MKINFSALFVLPFILLLFVGLFVPSDGEHGFLSIKSLSYISTILFLSIYFIIKNKLTSVQIKIILFLILGMLFLILWLFISFGEKETEFRSAFDQFKIFWITLSVIGFSLYVIKEKLLSFQTFVKLLIYFNLSYSLFKLGVVFLFLIGVINLSEFLELLGIRFMSMSIVSDLSRLQTSVDIMTPFLMLFVFQSKNLGIDLSEKFKIFYVIISLLSIFLSFSRFLIAVAFCSIILYALTLRISGMLKIGGYLLLASIAIVFAIGPQTTYNIIETRFFSSNTSISDSTRVDQIEALMNDFYKSPCLGKGLGGSSQECIRDTLNVHAYEVQWVSFLMQFGILGVFCLLLPISLVCRKFLIHINRVNLSFFFLFIIWLLSGFTNPFLISLTSGIIYSLFYLTSDYLEKDFHKY